MSAMHALSLFGHLGRAELKSVRRDAFLLSLAALPIAGALGIRWLVPFAEASFAIDLRPYYPLIASTYAGGLSPVVIGFMAGMVLLDERDAGTLLAVAVTPLSLGRYLAYKLTLPVLVTTILTLVCFPLAGLLPLRMSYVPVILVAALWAPILALLMATFARNKLQGFVLMRVSNIPVGAPLFAWFIPSAWQYAFGIIPSFWLLKAFWQAAAGQPSWVPMVVGLVLHIALLAWLLRRFRRTLLI